ncbi:MAG: metal-dependent transcriptional regulator [Acetatifactor sp.]
MKKRKTTEDYLKTIYMLSSKGEVRGIDIAKELGVTKSTVCVSLKELEAEGYLYMTQERTVILTDTGKEIAKDVLERNTVFRRLLLSLGVDKETAANDACEMEHAVSSKSFEALKQMIGKETKCERNG